MTPLKGHLAWITGASGGIGSAIARSLSLFGCDVVVSYFQSRETALQLVTECRKNGVRAEGIQVDISDRSSVIEARNKIRNRFHTSPSILIHSAGLSQSGLFQFFSDDDFNKMMNVHVKGAFYVTQETVGDMINRKNGRIIFLSSIWGEIGGANESLYSSAKGAQIAFAKSLAKEFAPSGITVNTVSPGAIKTKMLNHLDAEELEHLAKEIPLGRLGAPSEVASMVRYLCLPEAGYITGQVFCVNGGWKT